MRSLATVSSLLVASSLASSVSIRTLSPCDNASKHNQTLIWGTCDDIHAPSSGVQCATLTVPVDYLSNSSHPKTFDLELARIPAASGKSKGSVIINFGGPGGPGRGSLADLAPILSAMSGGELDLISFDPRATSNKTLGFNCFDSNEARTKLLGMYPPLMGNSSDTAHGYLWSVAEIWADQCAEKGKGTGSFIGTTYVVRDMMQIVDALQEDGMLRFWGFSYGTVLGAVAAAMFPEKIDKLVLDGVLNPHDYYQGFEDEQFHSTDATWTGFFEGCLAAGPSRCALASRQATAAEIEASVYNLLYTLKYHPVVYNSSIIIDYTGAKAVITSALYSPSEWPGLAAALDALLSSDLDPAKMESFITALLTTSAASNMYEANLGIKCGDKPLRFETSEDVEDTLHRLEESSRLLGDLTASVTMLCARWKLDARERYMGDFKVKTHNPALVIGNRYDPLTPLVSARNVSTGLEGSVLLEHNGFGHSSMAQPSSCTIHAIAAYFVNGTLPENGTVCDADVPIFMEKKATDFALQPRNRIGASPLVLPISLKFSVMLEQFIKA